MGDGPPLLLLHGWPQHWWMWRKVMPALAGRFRCIAPDLRGLGWTDAPPAGYEKSQLAADVLALLDVLGLERVPIAGHDWGAVIAQILAIEHPARVERVLSLSVPPVWDSRPDPRRLLGIAHMPMLAAPLAERAVPRLAGTLLRISGISGADAEPYLAVLRQPERRRATVGYYRSFLLRDLPGAVRSPSAAPAVPVRLMGGARDPVCRFAPSLERVPGAGHFLPEDDPEAVLRAAAEFL